MKNLNLLLIAIFIIFTCRVDATTTDTKLSTTKKPPNILWIFVEDISPHLGTYGEKLVKTPTLDQLAQKGSKFTNAIAPAPVCSAMRSAMMTGQMQTNLGIQNHHSSRTPESMIQLPEHVKTLPEIMKKKGYFTFNSGKDDYNFEYDRFDLYSGDYKVHPLYGKSGVPIDWNARKNKDQPFFGQIQLKGGKHIFNRNMKDKVLYPIDREKVVLPPYYPDDPVVVNEWARYLESLQITDREVASILKRLKDDGELENTVVFFFADHGMRFLRHKQFLYEGGLKVPFIAYWQGHENIVQKTVRDEQISLLDISATTLALAGIEKPDYFEGNNLFAQNYQAPKYVISARDRCDFTIDRIRSVRSEKFKYIKNFYPERSGMQPSYRDYWQLTKVTKELYEQGKLNEIQAQHFQPQRPVEELYNLEKDPHEIVNLATDPAYHSVLLEHRNVLEDWIRTSGDQGQFPEDEAALKLMLGIWGDLAINPEYDELRKKYPNLSGSQFPLKNAKFKRVNDKNYDDD
ncbi:sulfatase [Thalassotalea sp. PP2-459]|uniref:sulfatase family protein n=1 Tax=Thalassotalea sp. PP2-459 TaxID=1742724 RepID=UPI0009444334|nr:sulfatase [Thalassotalea sp. PP2-459]OKY25204.1 sulfatase [Thalassotalea sp. PP2-459]